MIAGLLSDDFDFRRAWCRRVLAVGMLLLVVATRPLWFSLGEFPQVPWFEVLCPTPQWVDWCLSCVMVASLVAMATVRAGTKWNQIAGCTVIGSLCCLLLLNQHRLQPWAWFVLIGTIATSARADYSLRWMRWLLFGVYFFSGLSKLEPSFIEGGGNWLIDGLLRPVGGSRFSLTRSGREFLLTALPIGEIVAALCLVIPRLRRVGFVLVLAMHGVLIFALGPWGLDHKPGVLVWNGMFQALAFPLLWHRNANAAEVCPQARRIGRAVVGLAVLLPCFGQRWLPLVDQWPSWSVYATWQEQLVHAVFVGRVPPDFDDQLLGAVVVGEFVDGTVLRLDLWSLEATGAPIYPSDRFRTGVCEGLARSPDIELLPPEPRDQFLFGTRSRSFRGH